MYSQTLLQRTSSNFFPHTHTNTNAAAAVGYNEQKPTKCQPASQPLSNNTNKVCWLHDVLDTSAAAALAAAAQSPIKLSHTDTHKGCWFCCHLHIYISSAELMQKQKISSGEATF